MKSTDYIDELLARYFAKESLTFAQRADLEEWRVKNRALFNQLQTLSVQLSPTTDIEFDSEKGWNTIEPELSHKSKRRVLSRYWTISVAASVLLVIVFSLSWYFQNETQTLQYTNTTAGKKEIVLPDHSIVNVYPEASIEYTAGKKRGERTLTLKGQAFFSVKKIKDRAFLIKAYNTQIKVIGTSFFVDAISVNHTNIEVETGKVSVTSNKRNIILTAGEQVVVTDSSMIKEQFSEMRDSKDTKPIILKFNKTPIMKVIRTLEDTFNISIQMDPRLKNNTITTKVYTDNLESILSELSHLCKCKYRKMTERQYELYIE